MTYLRGILRNPVTAASTLLLALTSASWAWSHTHYTWLERNAVDGRGARIEAERGWLTVTVTGRTQPGELLPGVQVCFAASPRIGWSAGSRPFDAEDAIIQDRAAATVSPWRPLRVTTWPGRPGASAQWILAARHWFTALLLATLPALRIAADARRSANSKLGRCPCCGYDLRATPDRCPECGHVTTTVHA